MKLKKILSTILAAAITLTAIPQAEAADLGGNAQVNKPYDAFLSNDDISVNGNNSLGDMLADKLNTEAVKQEDSLGYNIFSANLEGNTVKVSFETLQDCTLIAAVYDNDNKEMLASGHINVKAGDEIASVKVEGSIPQYFYIRAYLVSSDTMRPLCTEFATPLYTESMQEFLSKTVDDFDPDRVLNLDESKETNFAVFGEDVKLIPEVEGVNVVVSADSETLTYVFDNADTNISSLKSGEIFSYKYEDQLLIVKVDSVSANGSKVTVKGSEVGLEEVFEHLRIDAETGEAKADPSACGEGVEYLGVVNDPKENAAVIDSVNTGISVCGIFDTKIDIDETSSRSDSFGINKSGEGKVGVLNGEYSVSLTLELALDASLKLYYSYDFKFFAEDEEEAYIELKLGYSLKVKGEIEGNVALTFPITKFEIVLIPLVANIEITPSFIVELNGKVTLDGGLSGSVGFEASLEEGIRDISESPKFSLNGGVEVTLFIGFSLEPEITLLGIAAEVGLEAKVGGEATASLSKSTDSTGKYDSDGNLHQCDWCVNGEIRGKLSLSAEAELIKLFKFELTVAEITWHITDFYYSLSYNDFGFAKTCPHIAYKTDITVYGHDNKPLEGAKVIVDNTSEEIADTDGNGKTTAYLSSGYHAFIIKAKEYDNKHSEVNIPNNKTTVSFTFNARDLKDDADDGDHEGWGEALKKFLDEIIDKIKDKIKNGSSDPGDADHGGEVFEETDSVRFAQIESGAYGSAAITTDGDLYMWNIGYGNFSQKHPAPIKIMSNVAAVNLSSLWGALITKDGELYFYSWNGDFYNLDLSKFQEVDIIHNDELDCKAYKIMENVSSVYMGLFSYAVITKDGSLYVWGDNRHGQVGSGSLEEIISTPTKIMDNVVSFDFNKAFSDGYTCSAITDDNSLYIWGKDTKILDDGTTEDSSVPIKIMDNVVSLSSDLDFCNGASYAVVTTDGSLYCLFPSSEQPVKIMDNAKTVADNIVIDENGYLYFFYYENYGFKLWKLLSNVSSYEQNYVYDLAYAAITDDGTLYTGGWNLNGILGNGTFGDYSFKVTESNMAPQKIMENVDKVVFSVCGTTALTRNGELYAWGGDGWNGVGNGTEKLSYVPVKLEIPLDNDDNTTDPACVEPLVYQTAAAISADEEITFDSLLPNELYNYYAVKSRTVDNILSEGNLLYIGQAMSDENGKLTLPSYVKGDVVFVKAMTEFDVYNPRVTAEEISWDSVKLTWEGFENADKYEVYCYTTEGIRSVTEAYENSVVINGLEESEFYGFLVTATVHGESSVPASNDILVLQTAKKPFILADVNNDTKVNAIDAKLVLQYVSGSRSFTAEQMMAADVNRDGQVNAIDAKWILQIASGSRVLTAKQSS